MLILTELIYTVVRTVLGIQKLILFLKIPSKNFSKILLLVPKIDQSFQAYMMDVAQGDCG